MPVPEGFVPGKPLAIVPSPPERRLAAILAADIDRFALLQHDDHAAHRRISAEISALRSAVAEASGAIFAFAGHGLMAEFPSATQALTCALLFQANANERTAATSEPIRLRMAINAGEILVGDRHVGGATINLAAALARVAPPGGIAMPAVVHDQLRHVVTVLASPMGQPDLADRVDPVETVSISAEACVAWTGRITAPKPVPPFPVRDPRASLAVIPFRATAGMQAFADAATNDVIRALGTMATWMIVNRARATSVHGPIDLHRVRHASGARYILHGTVETERNMLRLTVELNEAESGRVMWSDRFDHVLDQQAALRADAAARSARAIPPLVLQRELDRFALLPSDDLTSHDLALQAFTLIMQPERATFFIAGEMLRQAEKRREPHGSARFARVWWHLIAISQGWSFDPAADRNAAGQAASGLDRNDPAAMALLAFMHSVLHRDHALASAMLDRVIDTAPSCGLAATLKALTLAWMGEAQTAIFYAEQAEAMPVLGPERAWRDHVTALTYYLAGRYSDAARWARVSAMHHSGLAGNSRVLIASLAVLGHLDEAYQATQQLLAIDPDFRVEAWRRRSITPEESRDMLAQRLKLAGLTA
jgi:adenylate cyclase